MCPLLDIKVNYVSCRARVLYTLATIFASRQTRPLLLEESITLYRAALILQPEDIDIYFNLAQALAEAGRASTALQAATWQEALNLLSVVEEKQMSLLVLAQPAADASQIEEDENDKQDSADSSMTISATETYTVVPSTVIETLLDRVGLIADIIESDVYPAASADLCTQAMQALDRAKGLCTENRTLIAIALTESTFKIAVIEQSPTSDPPKLQGQSLQDTKVTAMRAVVNQLAEATATKPDDIECLSAQADAAESLVDLSLTCSANAGSGDMIEEAIRLFGRLVGLLGSSITARGIASQSIAPTLSKSLASLSWLSMCKGEDRNAIEYACQAVIRSDTGYNFDTSGMHLLKFNGRTDAEAEETFENALLVWTRVNILLASGPMTQETMTQAVQNLRTANVSFDAVKDFADKACEDGLYTLRGSRYAEREIWTAILDAVQAIGP